MARKRNGIQPGTTASTLASRRLDITIRYAVKQLLAEPEFWMFERKTKLSKALIPGGVGACQPDGGILLLDGIIIASIEGKTQNLGGNAIERFGKNREIMRFVAPLGSYITFCAGRGTEDGGPIDNHVLQELAKENPENHGWNHFHNGASSFYKVDEEAVSVDELKNILRPILRIILSSFPKFKEEQAIFFELRQQTQRTYAAYSSYAI